MGKLVKGPFTLKWGENVIADVSDLTFNYESNQQDYETLDGRTYHVPTTINASVEMTLLATDVNTLSVLFPQYYVEPGGTLSTGEKVAEEGEGAIDIVAASCDTTDTTNPLDIIGCDQDSTTRLVNAKTSLSGLDLADSALRTVTVTFTGTPDGGQAAVQFINLSELSQ